LPRSLRGNVDSDGAGTLAHFLGDGLGQSLVHIGDDDGCALGVQFFCNALAEALGSTGDDGDLAGQTAFTCRTVVDIGLCQLGPFGHFYAHNRHLLLK
jgi:hypothetical protein